MLITRLLLFSSLVTASHPGVRRRQCAGSSPASIAQSSQGDISSSFSSNATASGSTISLIAVSTSSTAPSTETTIPEPFLLQIQAKYPQTSPRRKRQELPSTYLEGNSATGPRCEQGAVFQLLNGRLLKEGAVITVSDPPKTQPLLEAGASRDISITFSLTEGILSWSNSRFPRQTALFCLLANTAYVYFEDAPAGCVDITLSFTSLSECPGRQALSSKAAFSTLSTLSSQLSPGPILSTRPASSAHISTDSTASDDVTPSITPTAAESTSNVSSPDASSIIGYSSVATTVLSPTAPGTSYQISLSPDLSTSNGFILPTPTGDSSSLSSATTGSASPSSSSPMDQPPEIPPSPSSAEVVASSQWSFSPSFQPTRDTVRPSSATFDSLQSQSASFEPISTQSVALSPNPTSSSSTILSSEILTSLQTPQSTAQSRESLSASAEGLSISSGLLSMTSIHSLGQSSLSKFDTSNTEVTRSTPSSFESTESATSTSSRVSATYMEPVPSSPATSASTPSITETRGIETSTTTLNTSEISQSRTSVLNITPPSSTISEVSTSLTSSTGPLSSSRSGATTSERSTASSESSTMSSYISSSITSSTSYASDSLSASSLSSSSSPGTSSSTSSSTSIPTSLSSSSSSSSTSSSSSSSGTPSSTPKAVPPGNLLCTPSAPERNMKFGVKTDTVGSVGYTGQATADYLELYVTSILPGATNWNNLGYLYHPRSGLCVTAIASSSISPKYLGGSVQLQPCDSSNATPPEAQTFGGGRPMGVISVLFRGDRSASQQPYGASSGSNSNVPVILSSGGVTWYIPC